MFLTFKTKEFSLRLPFFACSKTICYVITGNFRLGPTTHSRILETLFPNLLLTSKPGCVLD